MLNKRRLKFLITGLIIPLILGIFVVSFLYIKFGYLLFPKTNTSASENYVETNTPLAQRTYIKVGEISDPNDKEEEVKGTTVKTPKTTASTTTKKTVNWWEYPSKIYPATKSGNDLLVLVNKKYKLPSSYAPTDLIDVQKSGIRTKNNLANTYFVRKILKMDLKALNEAAKAKGIDLSVVSAYRSYATQKSTYNYWLSVNGGCVGCTDKVSARAGHSQHQLATAIDFSSKEINDGLAGRFYTTKASSWLAKNAYKYGFVISYPSGYESTTGYSYEAWHYRYIGRANALEMHNSGKILETYLKSKN